MVMSMIQSGDQPGGLSISGISRVVDMAMACVGERLVRCGVTIYAWWLSPSDHVDATIQYQTVLTMSDIDSTSSK